MIPSVCVLINNTSLLVQATVDDLKKALHEKKRKWHPCRQRLTLPAKAGQKSGEPLMLGIRLQEYGLKDGSVVVFKDLGPQVRMLRC